MRNKICVFLACLAVTAGAARAETLVSGGETTTKTIVTGEVNTALPWGRWISEVYMPYSNELGRAILDIARAAGKVQMTGKSTDDALEDITVVLNQSLTKMENIKPPVELKAYHNKIVQLYKETINTDASEPAKSQIMKRQLTREADAALKTVFERHGVPENVIANFVK